MPKLLTSVRFISAILLLGPMAAVAGMYRYIDENGQMVISNTVPQEATKRGYDILGSQGQLLRSVAPALTEEEIAAREAEKQRQKELEQQREQDKLLLKRFSSADQAVRAMHRKVRELEGLIQLKRGNISVLTSQLDTEQSRAANMERSGKTIPPATLTKIRRLEDQVRTIEREISAQEQEIEQLRTQFKADIQRLEEITGKPRTLPLENNKGES